MSLFDGFKKKKAEKSNTQPEKGKNEISNNNVSAGEESEGYYFENAEELAVYGKLHNNGKTAYWLTGNNYIDAYKIGYQLFEKGQYRQAIEAYQNSLKLNPIGISARFEICESYIHLNDLEKAKSVLLDMKDYLYKAEDIAKFYRRIGYIEAERRNYRAAEACVLYSIKYQDIDSAYSELEFLRTKNRQPITPSEIEKVIKDFSIPLIAPQNVEKTVVTSLSQAEKQFFKQTCPKCGATITHSYYQFYEVTKEEQAIKKQLLKERSKFFEAKCPKCGVSASIQYPLQYIDTEKKLNIYLMPIGHPDENKFFDQVEKFNTRPGFITRLVADGDALVDKISVFDANLDDRVVELSKVLLWGDLCEQQPKYENAECNVQWFIHSDNNKEYENTILFGYEMNGKRDSVILALDDDYYQNIKKHFEPIFPLMKKVTFDEVNRKWAYDAIDIFKQHRNA